MFIRSVCTVTVTVAPPLTVNTQMIMHAAKLIHQTRLVLTCNITETRVDVQNRLGTANYHQNNKMAASVRFKILSKATRSDTQQLWRLLTAPTTGLMLPLTPPMSVLVLH